MLVKIFLMARETTYISGHRFKFLREAIVRSQENRPSLLSSVSSVRNLVK